MDFQRAGFTEPVYTDPGGGHGAKIADTFACMTRDLSRGSLLSSSMLTLALMRLLVAQVAQLHNALAEGKYQLDAQRRRCHY